MAKKKKTAVMPDMMSKEELALKFAKAIASQTIHDPTGTKSKRTSRSYSGYDKETIEGYLASPTANEKNLRDASIYLYQTSSRYRHLLSYFANLPCWYYTIGAVNYNPDKVKAENFRKQYLKTCDVLESMGLVRIMREATLIAQREGVCFGVIWGGDGSQFILQKLDPDNCTIVSLDDGNVFSFTYDMSKVKEEDLDAYYPAQFRTMWNEYQSSGNQYQPVPPEISFCLKADPTIPEYNIPPFASVLPTLYSIKSVEELAVTSEELQNYKLLSAKLPVDNNGVPIMSYESAMQYYSHISNNLAEMVGLCLSPFDIKDYDFSQSGTTNQVNAVSRATENFFASAGTTAQLHGIADNTSAVTKLAIHVDESYAFSYVYQCESIINRFLKLMTGTVKFRIRFLPVTAFNRDEMVSMYRNAMNYGIGKTEYMVALGIPQADLLGKSYIENDVIGIDDLFRPPHTAAQTTSEDNGAGRPVSPDGQIGDEGDRARDKGLVEGEN